MARLIDADDFKKFLQALCEAGAPYHVVIKLLDKQQTAYDPERVMQQIGDISELIRPVGWSRKIEVVETKAAIEIVRKGGAE